MSTGDWTDVAISAFLLIYALGWGLPILWWTQRLVREKTRTGARGLKEIEDAEVMRGAGLAGEPEEMVPAPPRVRPLDRETEVEWPSEASQRAFESTVSWRSGLAGRRIRRFAWVLIVLLAALGIAEWQGWFGPQAGESDEVLGRWLAIAVYFLGFLLVALAGALVDRALSRRTASHNRSVGDRAVFGGSCLLLKLGLGAFAVWLLDPARIPLAISGVVAILIVLAPYPLVGARWRNERTVPRVDLLMLRVFGTGRSGYLYSKIEPLWERVGSTFTLVSEDLAQLDRLRIPTRSWVPLLLFLIGPPIVVALIVGGLYLEGDLPMWAVVATALAQATLAVLATRRPVEKMVERSFLASPESLSTELERLWKGVGRRRPGGAYRHRHLTCTGTTWRPVVSLLLDRCGAVLVDFRGCQPANLGLRYELQLAFRKVPMERILILVDDGIDQALLSETLARSWSSMEPTSPNWKCSPGIKVFRSTRKKMRTSEARRVVAWLFRDAVAPHIELSQDPPD